MDKLIQHSSKLFCWPTFSITSANDKNSAKLDNEDNYTGQPKTQIEPNPDVQASAVHILKLVSIQRRLAWPSRRDDTHNREANPIFLIH